MRIIPVPCIPLVPCEKLSAGILATIHASLSPWADIVHLHTVGPGVMGWFPRLCRKPSLIQFHGVEWKRTRWSPFGSAVLKALERWSVRVNRHFTAVSRVQCEYFRDTYGIQPLYIPGGATPKPRVEAAELSSLGLEPGRYVLFASRLVREKGAHYLIEAFRRASTGDRLVMAGDAPGSEAYKRELHRLAADDPRILWPGFVQGRLLEELFCHARVFIQPSDVEGLSLALLEAMSYGTPCLASDIPENVEALGPHGTTFRRGDVGDLAAKLQNLLDKPRVEGDHTARIRQEYSWDHVADEFERYYRQIIHGAPPAEARPAPLGG
jgi:glycosyltransferase involved in cell wall biosynthesis